MHVGFLFVAYAMVQQTEAALQGLAVYMQTLGFAAAVLAAAPAAAPDEG